MMCFVDGFCLEVRNEFELVFVFEVVIYVLWESSNDLLWYVCGSGIVVIMISCWVEEVVGDYVMMIEYF